MKDLLAIGFWYADDPWNRHYPHPRSLVYKAWVSTFTKEKLAAYLRGGAIKESYLGWSYCRFDCVGQQLGTKDLTDGTWVWPEGLAHYVEKHDVMLPVAFVVHCRDQGWAVPPCEPKDSSSRYAQSFWLEWSKRWSRIPENS